MNTMKVILKSTLYWIDFTYSERINKMKTELQIEEMKTITQEKISKTQMQAQAAWGEGNEKLYETTSIL